MSLGPEWTRGADGRLFRTAARLILLDEHDRVLLARGHDVDNPSRGWWFTIGGGIDAGETPEQAAVRELFEETGLRLAQSELVGPVLTREAVFDFQAEAVRQDEVFFLARIATPASLSTEGWTEIERGFMDDLRWWSVEELHEMTIEIFPAELPEVVTQLRSGWDGQTRHLGLGVEGTSR